MKNPFPTFGKRASCSEKSENSKPERGAVAKRGDTEFLGPSTARIRLYMGLRGIRRQRILRFMTNPPGSASGLLPKSDMPSASNEKRETGNFTNWPMNGWSLSDPRLKSGREPESYPKRSVIPGYRWFLSTSPKTCWISPGKIARNTHKSFSRKKISIRCRLTTVRLVSLSSGWCRIASGKYSEFLARTGIS